MIIAMLLGSSASFAQKKNADSHPQLPAVSHYKEIGDPLPPIMVYTLDGRKITNKDMNNDANLFVMLFNPTCSHCEEMTKQLERNIKLFNKSKILMVAPHTTKDYVQGFEDGYHTSKYAPIITMGVDSSMHLVDKTFQYKAIPQISIYDKDRKLIKVFSGEISIDSLKPYIQ